MLQKEEFQITVETIEPSLESLKGAIQGVHSFYELLKSGKNMKRISLLFSNICYWVGREVALVTQGRLWPEVT